MAMVSTSISIDEATKKEALALLEDFGMDLSTAVNVFLKQMIYDGAFPFIITRESTNAVYDETPNEETRQAIENVRLGKNLSRGFQSVEELMADLNADD